MAVARSSITWLLTAEASKDLEDIRAALGETYDEDVNDLRDYLCGYFSTEIGCTGKLGKSISPIGRVGSGKSLKVRWMTPGCGKSGGLRLAIVVYCESLRVVLCRAFMRSADPGHGDFEAAAELASDYEGKDEDDEE